MDSRFSSLFCAIIIGPPIGRTECVSEVPGGVGDGGDIHYQPLPPGKWYYASRETLEAESRPPRIV